MNVMLIETAKQLAITYHEGQKYGDKDYFLGHICSVVSRVVHNGGNDVEIATAYLHDILEDTRITPQELLSALHIGCGDFRLAHGVVDAVYYLTKHKGESYESYIYDLSFHPIAAKVKYYDSAVNMDACIRQGSYEKAKKYLNNLCILHNVVFGKAQ